jgi:hypothetical protein
MFGNDRRLVNLAGENRGRRGRRCSPSTWRGLCLALGLCRAALGGGLRIGLREEQEKQGSEQSIHLGASIVP